MKTDHKLKKQITKELTWAPQINADQIGIAVDNGVVTLTGSVDSFRQKRDVELATSRVKGVRGIAEEIEVRLPGHVQKGDDEIAQAAIHRFDWHSLIPTNSVQVKVEKGWVTLTGEVDWQYQKDWAMREVRPMLGVTGVSNQICLKTRPDTEKISKDIGKALRRTQPTDANVKVTATEGRVRLTGHVPTWRDRQLAQATAWSAPGTASVQNDISVA